VATSTRLSNDFRTAMEWWMNIRNIVRTSGEGLIR
jgi:plasmid maintenance system antidote protein VapI